MIKRRFYKQDHGDNSGTSDSSSSDDFNSFPEADDTEDHEVEDGEDEEEEEQERGNSKNTIRFPSPGSGYESEDCSNDQGDTDTSDERSAKDVEIKNDGKALDKVPDYEVGCAPEITGILKDSESHNQIDISNFILKFKSVFKCRLCPRILCLNEDTVRTHLSSKRHARSKKLHDEGRLKLMLNSDGELEEEQETHAERHARIMAISQKPSHAKKDNRRRRPNEPRRKRMHSSASNKGKSEPSVQSSAKKRRRMDD